MTPQGALEHRITLGVDLRVERIPELSKLSEAAALRGVPLGEVGRSV